MDGGLRVATSVNRRVGGSVLIVLGITALNEFVFLSREINIRLQLIDICHLVFLKHLYVLSCFFSYATF